MGGVLEIGGKGLASSLNVWKQQKSTEAYYRRLAASQDAQALAVEEDAQRQNGYLLQSAREKAQAVYNNYRQTVANQQVRFAQVGLHSDSATVQQMLKNSRFQALLDAQGIQENLQTNVLENNLAAAQQVRALKESAQAYRRAARKGMPGWKWGTSLLGLFSAH